MLHYLKRWASGWVASFLMFLLILSFAIWGIADYITGVSRSALATVGSEEISPEQFQYAFQNELNSISQQAGQRISFEQARAVGLDRRVLSQMIGSAAVAEHGRELGLSLSEETVIEGLKKDPAFAGPDGQFSRAVLENAMRQLGLSEAQLIERRRRDELQQHLTTALMRGTVVPEALIQALHKRREEQRTVEHFTIDADKVISLPEPSEDDLKSTYEQNKPRFMSPETRHLAVLLLPLSEVKKRAEITEEQLRQTYEETKASYDKPERRRIQQIAFKDRAAAEAAKAEIAAGKDFIEVAKATGAQESDIDLGLLERGQLIDGKIADAAFSLEKDTVSDVIEGTFTTVLLRVTEIEPGEPSTFEGVKDKVRDKLAEDWARGQVQKFYNEVDDGRGAGKPLKDIAAEMKLPFFDIPTVTRQNTTLDGKRVLDVPDANELIADGFRGEVGFESDPVRLADGGFGWVDVLNVMPAAQKPFDEVKDEVKTLWTQIERRRKLSEFAQGLVDKIKSGADMAAVAEEAGGSVVMAPPTTRARIPDGLTQAAMSQVFVLPKDGVGHAETSDGKSQTVFRVVEIKEADAPTDAQRTAVETELRDELRADQIAEYVGGLRNRFGVTINEQAFRRVTGAETGEPAGRAY